MSPFTEDEREQQLRHLMEVYGDGLKRLCCVYLRDMGLAEDAVQETFIKAYDHIDELLSGKIESTKAWLMRIAVNTCKDTLRSSWMRHIDNRQEIEALPLSIASCAEERLALVLGTEGDGLSPATIARCDYTVRIPMHHGVDSLNVAAASAVAFWELRAR